MTPESPRRILITSALPYSNGVKHLGNLAGSMLPADVCARVMRLMGHDVVYICATDEHGTPAELAAQAAGQSVRAYCDEQHAIQRAAGAAFALSYDYFGRSSDASMASSSRPPRQHPGCRSGRCQSSEQKARQRGPDQA